jgi:transcriptional regulator with XRE-family HTH domain
MQLILQKQFRDIIEHELDRRKMRRSELARAMNVAPQMVTDYLNGRRDPGPEVIEKFFNALDLEPKLTFRRKVAALAS